MNGAVRIGVAGCGAMGRPMAENLIAAGYDTVGFDVRARMDFGDFAHHMADDVAAFIARTEVLISVVRDIAETEALLFDDQAVLRADDPPKTVVLSSTLSPRYVIDVAARIPDGVTLIDAPMSGAPYRARNGTLTFMVGGIETTVNGLMPCFQAMGEAVHYLGASGAGAAAKVCNNLCAAAGVVAVRRALATAGAYGIAQQTMLDVMRTSSGSTWYGDHLDDIDWAREGFDPANTMGILEKDVSSFIDARAGKDCLEDGRFEEAILAEIRRLEPLS